MRRENFLLEMKKTNLPKSIRKYIRKEKARIRREVLDLAEQEKLIQELYQKFLNLTSNNLTSSNLTSNSIRKISKSPNP